jgi:hypothetical protein
VILLIGLVLCTTNQGFFIVNASQDSDRLNFDGNSQLETYFASHPEMDGLTPETAYLFDDLVFTDPIDSKVDVTGYMYYYVHLTIKNTDRYINISNCVFQRHPSAYLVDDILVSLYLVNCSKISIFDCKFEFNRGLEIKNCDNITVNSCEFLTGLCVSTYSNNTLFFNNSFHTDVSKIHDMIDYCFSRFVGGCSMYRCINTSVINNTFMDVRGLSFGSNMQNTTVKNNICIRSQFEVSESLTEIPIIDNSNTVNGRYAYFYFNEHDLIEANFTDAGQVYLSFCENCSVGNINSLYLQNGIALIHCNNITLYNSTVIYPIYSGIKIDCSSEVVLENNSIFGWTYNWQKYTSVNDNQNPLANIGIWIRGYTLEQKSNNINITQNVICGYQYGMFIFTYANVGGSFYQVIDNVSVWDNYYAYNGINGYVSYPSWYTEHKWVTFNNETMGNYWDDYEVPRIADSDNLPSGSSSPIPSASADVWEGSYNVNGVLDQKPLKTYDHAVVLFDLVALYPWSIDSLNIWMIVGIAAGCIGIAGIFLYLKKSGKIRFSRKDSV